ncbi:BMP family ABC transporter substrate-binding protein [bacterium]|nr:BMP family ABC transporter substrate-binding protein [bacterium]
MCGFNHITPLNSIGVIKENDEKKKYKSFDSNFGNAAYILYDGDISNNQNIASVSFRADQSAFLTGIACCVELLKNVETYHKDGREMSIGIFGGVMIPTVLVFMGGIERGIELFNKHILPNIIKKIIDNDKETINDFPDLKKMTKFE